MCGGRRDENGPFDFTINAAWDYCGPSNVYHDESSGEIVLSFTVLGDIDAITNDDGLLMSRALSFQAECAFKDHLEVSETFTADLGGMMRRNVLNIFWKEKSREEKSDHDFKGRSTAACSRGQIELLLTYRKIMKRDFFFPEVT